MSHSCLVVCLGTCFTTFLHSSLVAGRHFLALDINILGDGGELVLADLVRNLVTHLAGRVDIITHLEGMLMSSEIEEGGFNSYLLGNVLTDLSVVSGALSLSDLPGNSPGHQGTHSPLLVLTVLGGNLGTRLS